MGITCSNSIRQARKRSQGNAVQPLRGVFFQHGTGLQLVLLLFYHTLTQPTSKLKIKNLNSMPDNHFEDLKKWPQCTSATFNGARGFVSFSSGKPSPAIVSRNFLNSTGCCKSARVTSRKPRVSNSRARGKRPTRKIEGSFAVRLDPLSPSVGLDPFSSPRVVIMDDGTCQWFWTATSPAGGRSPATSPADGHSTPCSH